MRLAQASDPVPLAAAAYAKRGWRVLPLWWITSDGTCACGQADCKPGKHPRIKSWPALASSAGADVWEWWQQWPDANVGIATGRVSGIWTLDIDPDNGGDVTLAELIAEHGPLPATRRHRTGSGGEHYIFSYPPDFDVPRIASSLFGKGIDTLGEDSQIVAPPSVSGKGAYTVMDGREPVAAPEWLLQPLREHAAQKATTASATVAAGEPVDQAAIPARLTELLAEIPGGGYRSDHFWEIITAVRDAGWTQGQAVTLAAPWCKASGKYIGRVEKQVAACWGKLVARQFPASLITGDGQPAAPGPAAARFKAKAGNRNPVDVADDVGQHLLASNDPPQLFSMAPSAVVLRNGKLQPLDPDGWLYYVARRVDFCITSRDGEPRIVQPPAGAMKLIPSVMIPDLPSLDGIATTPYLDQDGNVVAEDGYHPGTRLVLHTGGLRLPMVSAAPGDEEVALAVKLLAEDWLGDFPFASDADRANAIAVLLTLTGRMFFALAPLFVFDASTAGSGKGLLVTTISLIATGEPPQLMELPADGEEQRKKITSALLAGQRLITWDESHVIAGRTLAMILTAETYSDRLLGGNKMIAVRNQFTQVALGNNVEVWGDMKRRVVPSRLVPDTDHPEHRDDFRYPDLEGWVRDHRGELLAAVLTIWRNWIAKGRPAAPAGMGSFDRWARAVGGALQAAGVEAFRSNTTDWLSDSDDDDGWGDHLTQLRSRWGDKSFTPAEVADAVSSGYIKRPPVKQDPDKTLSQQLPYSYRKIRERWHGDLRLVRSPTRESASGGRTWSVQKRKDPLRRGTPEPSSASSASPAEGTDSQVTGSLGFQQPSLTMLSGDASSVDAGFDETAGQNGFPDDTDHSDDENLAPDPWGSWPDDTFGEGENR